MDYYNKYLKYKTKYIYLKTIFGGTNETNVQENKLIQDDTSSRRATGHLQRATAYATQEDSVKATTLSENETTPTTTSFDSTREEVIPQPIDIKVFPHISLEELEEKQIYKQISDEIVAQLPAHTNYLHEKDPNIIFKNIIELIHNIETDSYKRIVTVALRKHGYTIFEINKEAKKVIFQLRDQPVNFKFTEDIVNTNNVCNKCMIYRVMEQLIQSIDFIQHIIEIMLLHGVKLHLKNNEIIHVAQWWLLQYISLTNPQIIHSLIKANKTVGPSDKSRGKSLVSYYKQFKNLENQLKSHSQIFKKLTTIQKRNLFKIAQNANKIWHDTVLLTSRQQVVIVPPFPTNTSGEFKDFATNIIRNFKEPPTATVLIETKPFENILKKIIGNDLDILLKGGKELQTIGIHTCRLYNGDRVEDQLQIDDEQLQQLKNIIINLINIQNENIGLEQIKPYISDASSHTRDLQILERYGTFYVHINKLLDTPILLFQLLDGVFKLDDLINEKELIDIAYTGGFYRYGVDFYEYTKVITKQHDTTIQQNYMNMLKYSMPSIKQFQINCSTIITELSAKSQHIKVLMRPNVIKNINTGVYIANTDVYYKTPVTKYKNSAIFTALLFLCSHYVTSLQNYVQEMDKWYQMLEEYGINITEQSNTTDDTTDDTTYDTTHNTTDDTTDDWAAKVNMLFEPPKPFVDLYIESPSFQKSYRA
jgi:hypothetical protein